LVEETIETKGTQDMDEVEFVPFEK